MALRFFAVPVHDSSTFEQELNGFLASHKVVSIDRQLIDQGINSFWAICVDYLSHAPGETNHRKGDITNIASAMGRRVSFRHAQDRSRLRRPHLVPRPQPRQSPRGGLPGVPDPGR
jgi:hypothetical protein